MTDERDSIKDYFEVSKFFGSMSRFNIITTRILKRKEITKQEAQDCLDFLHEYEEQIKVLSKPWLEQAGLPANVDRYVYMVEGYLKRILEGA